MSPRSHCPLVLACPPAPLSRPSCKTPHSLYSWFRRQLRPPLVTGVFVPATLVEQLPDVEGEVPQRSAVAAVIETSLTRVLPLVIVGSPYFFTIRNRCFQDETLAMSFASSPAAAARACVLPGSAPLAVCSPALPRRRVGCARRRHRLTEFQVVDCPFRSGRTHNWIGGGAARGHGLGHTAG